jgi:hypothetical protein
LSVLACQDEVFVNNPLDVQENDEHVYEFALYFQLGRLLPCLRVITVNPALVISDDPGQKGCIIGGNLMKLLTDIETLLLLISCQKSHQAIYMTPNKRM